MAVLWRGLSNFPRRHPEQYSLHNTDISSMLAIYHKMDHCYIRPANLTSVSYYPDRISNFGTWDGHMLLEESFE